MPVEFPTYFLGKVINNGEIIESGIIECRTSNVVKTQKGPQQFPIIDEEFYGHGEVILKNGDNLDDEPRVWYDIVCLGNGPFDFYVNGEKYDTTWKPRTMFETIELNVIKGDCGGYCNNVPQPSCGSFWFTGGANNQVLGTPDENGNCPDRCWAKNKRLSQGKVVNGECVYLRITNGRGSGFSDRPDCYFCTTGRYEEPIHEVEEVPWICKDEGITTISECESWLNNNIASLELTLEEKLTLIDQLNSEIHVKIELIKELTASVDYQVALISQLQLTLDEQAQVIKEIELTIEQQADYIARLDLSVEEQARIINKLELTVQEQAQLIIKLRLSVEEQARLINDLTDNLAEKAALVDQLTVTNEEQANLIKQMKLSFAEQGGIIAQLDQTVQEDAHLIQLLTGENDEQGEIIAAMKLTTEEQQTLIMKITAVNEEQAAIIAGMKLTTTNQQELINKLTTENEQMASLIEELKLTQGELNSVIEQSKSPKDMSVFTILLILVALFLVYYFGFEKGPKKGFFKK